MISVFLIELECVESRADSEGLELLNVTKLLDSSYQQGEMR